MAGGNGKLPQFQDADSISADLGVECSGLPKETTEQPTILILDNLDVNRACCGLCSKPSLISCWKPAVLPKRWPCWSGTKLTW